MPIRVFRADVLDRDQVAAGLDGVMVDIVLTDTPYGTMTGWLGEGVGNTPSILPRMLSALRPVLRIGTIVVTIRQRGVRSEVPGYRRVQRFRSGHREALFWRAC